MKSHIRLGLVFGLLTVFIATYQCARIRRIVGGDQLDAGAWPWLVSLNYKQHHSYLDLQGLKHLCGATLIDQQWVLTAAHCVHYMSGSEGLGEPENWIAVLGEYDRRVAEETEQGIDVESIHVHPNYTLFPQLTGDIALLKLKRPAQITASVRPISLDTIRALPAGTICKAAGWGQHTSADIGQPQYGNGTLLPHVIEVKRVSQLECAAAYDGLWPLIDDKIVCFNSNLRRDTCQGDSGGPLICECPEGKSVLTGIVSVGMGCALDGYPGIYTRVSSYRNWVVETIEAGNTPINSLDNLV